MGDNAQVRRRLGVMLVTATAALPVAAAPAVAKGPLFPVPCHTTTSSAPLTDSTAAVCEGRSSAQQTADGGSGFEGDDAGIIAGSAALVVLLCAGGMLVATHRRDAQETRPAAVARAAGEGG